MGFRFEPGDRSAETAVRRLVRELLRDAIRQSERDAGDSPASVHEFRKLIKKTRAVTSLVRPGFRDYRRVNAILAGLGRAAADARRTEVLPQTLDRLLARAPGDDALQKAAAILRHGFQATAKEAARHPDLPLAPALARLRAEAAEWQLHGRGFDPIWEGLEDAWRRARSALDAVSPGEPETVHALRKRLKSHWYHARLLTPAWPEVISAHAAIAGAITEDLGEHNDLADLIAVLPGADLPGPSRDHIARLAAERAAQIRDGALVRARFFLAERPSVLSDRWQSWWRLWRAGEQPREGTKG